MKHKMCIVKAARKLTFDKKQHRKGVSNKSIPSILFLNNSHLEDLIKLKKYVLNHITKVYGYNEKEDNLKLYFHFPYGSATVTLHLHIRINQPMHPVEALRSFTLDEVMDRLSKKTENPILDMIHERIKSNKGYLIPEKFRPNWCKLFLVGNHKGCHNIPNIFYDNKVKEGYAPSIANYDNPNGIFVKKLKDKYNRKLDLKKIEKYRDDYHEVLNFKNIEEISTKCIE